MPRGAEKVMRNCCETLEEMKITYFLTDGTALGLYREGKYIQHDTDIDVDIIGEYDLYLIEKKFRDKLHMNLGRKLFYKNLLQQLVFYTDDEIIFDMVFWRKEGDYYYVNFPECEYRCKLHSKYFGEPYLYTFSGKTYPLHSRIEEWLVDRYGNDWNVPKTAKGDWREDCNYFDN